MLIFCLIVTFILCHFGWQISASVKRSKEAKIERDWKEEGKMIERIKRDAFIAKQSASPTSSNPQPSVTPAQTTNSGQSTQPLGFKLP